jgi:hypothetical protein|eukprot:g3299.t1
MKRGEEAEEIVNTNGRGTTSPRQVPVPNLVPTLELKQMRRQEYMEKASLKFTPTSDAAQTLGLGISELGINSASGSKAVKKKRRVRRRSRKKKLAKGAPPTSSSAALPSDLSHTVPNIHNAMFAMKTVIKLPNPLRHVMKRHPKKKKEVVDKYATSGVFIYGSPGLKQKLPVIQLPKGKLGHRMFTPKDEILKEELQAGKGSPVASGQQRGNSPGKMESQKRRKGRTARGEPSPQRTLKVNPAPETRFVHSRKKHVLYCEDCLDEFPNMSKLKFHSQYKCPQRLLKCTNPCCGQLVPARELAQHRSKTCIWLRYNLTVINEGKKEKTWPKLTMRSLSDVSRQRIGELENSKLDSPAVVPRINVTGEEQTKHDLNESLLARPGGKDSLGKRHEYINTLKQKYLPIQSYE